MTRKAAILSKDAAQYRSYLVGELVDTVSNNFLIKNFGSQDQERDNFSTISQEMADKETGVELYLFKAEIVQSALKICLFGGLVPILYWFYKNLLLTPGEVAFIISATIGYESHIYSLRKHILEYLKSYGILKQALEDVYTPHTVVDKPDAQKIVVDPGTITFNKINFAYNDSKKLFENFSLSIKPQQKVALIGTSGVGKTTLVKLLLRFYDVQSGQILIDGQDIREYSQESLRQNISVIPQDTSLFHRSIMDNIRYGLTGATDEEIYTAAKKAHIHDFILSLPKAYQTYVGERGVKLSGGQKQRIAIARAILKNAPILILDEATSALDSESEKAIQESFKNLMHNKTVIAIAHRLSTISHMDRIVVMEERKIIEDDAHEHLLKNKNSLYSKLWRMQSNGFLNMKQKKSAQ